MDEFRGRRWMPLQPKHLDYPNAQLLLIGESHGLDHATEALDWDQKHEKETPLEEMEKLEGEDEIRVKHLKGKHPTSVRGCNANRRKKVTTPFLRIWV